ncbi:MAG: glycosyltransferase, partial [Candidatus Dadabacteria bacterium]|nr:glycosyltransferase [Candidatus Dadabacteria bacterium]
QIIDGQTGFLHDPYDIKGFSESIIRLIKDRELRERLGENGRLHIKKSFLITRLMLDWLNIFKEHLVSQEQPAAES